MDLVVQLFFSPCKLPVHSVLWSPTSPGWQRVTAAAVAVVESNGKKNVLVVFSFSLYYNAGQHGLTGEFLLPKDSLGTLFASLSVSLWPQKKKKQQKHRERCRRRKHLGNEIMCLSSSPSPSPPLKDQTPRTPAVVVSGRSRLRIKFIT